MGWTWTGGDGGTGTGTGLDCEIKLLKAGAFLASWGPTRAACDAISRKIYNAPKEIVQKLQTKHAQEDIKYPAQGHPPIIT